MYVFKLIIIHIHTGIRLEARGWTKQIYLTIFFIFFNANRLELENLSTINCKKLNIKYCFDICFSILNISLKSCGYIIIYNIPNGQFCDYYINVSHPCLIIFLSITYSRNLPNYLLRAQLRFMNFTQLEWTD